MAQLLGAVSDVAGALDSDADWFPSLCSGPAGCNCRGQLTLHLYYLVVLVAVQVAPSPAGFGVLPDQHRSSLGTPAACLVQLQARLRMQEQFQEDMQGGMQTSIAWDVRQTQASPA